MQNKTRLLVFAFLWLTHFSFSQKVDSTTQKKESIKSLPYFSGSIGITNNGISIVPSFSLDKPAFNSICRWEKTGLALNRTFGFQWRESPGLFFSGAGTN